MTSSSPLPIRALHLLHSVAGRAEPWVQTAVLLALRLIYGWFFAQAGWGKLANLERTTGFFENLGLPLPALMAGLVATVGIRRGPTPRCRGGNSMGERSARLRDAHRIRHGARRRGLRKSLGVYRASPLPVPRSDPRPSSFWRRPRFLRRTSTHRA